MRVIRGIPDARLLTFRLDSCMSSGPRSSPSSPRSRWRTKRCLHTTRSWLHILLSLWRSPTRPTTSGAATGGRRHGNFDIILAPSRTHFSAPRHPTRGIPYSVSVHIGCRLVLAIRCYGQFTSSGRVGGGGQSVINDRTRERGFQPRRHQQLPLRPARRKPLQKRGPAHRRASPRNPPPSPPPPPTQSIDHLPSLSNRNGARNAQVSRSSISSPFPFRAPGALLTRYSPGRPSVLWVAMPRPP